MPQKQELPHCRMSWTCPPLSLTSSTKIQLWILLSLQRTGRRRYPQRVWGKSCWEWILIRQLVQIIRYIILKTCADQPADVITDIFLHPALRRSFPPLPRHSIIFPVPKKSAVSSLNDYHPVALAPILMKLALQHIKDHIPASLDPRQYPFRANRSAEDAISAALHSVFTHLENKSSYIRMLFVDFSSAFSTISSSELIGKLITLGLSTTLSNWILDFLTSRPKRVRIGSRTSSTGGPQGCVLGPPPVHTIIGWWELISRGNQQSCRAVHRQRCTARHQQNQGAEC